MSPRAKSKGRRDAEIQSGDAVQLKNAADQKKSLKDFN